MNPGLTESAQAMSIPVSSSPTPSAVSQSTANEYRPLLPARGNGQVSKLHTPHESPRFHGDEELIRLVEIDDWYSNFTFTRTISFMWSASKHMLAFYIPWSLLFTYLHFTYEVADYLKADSLLKTLTFLVGICISLTLKESMDRYQLCLAQVLNFRDEFRSFWYHIQSLLPEPEDFGARYIFDIHMVAFALSCLRFIDRSSNVDETRALSLIQPELRHCVLFSKSGMYYHLFGNPVHAEFLLVSWLRVLGVMDQETRLHWQWVRTKLHSLMAVRVRLPYTGKHLLRAVLNIFLILVPMCSEAVFTKLATPPVCMILGALLQLAEELEYPFGEFTHDLPVYSILASVAHMDIKRSCKPRFRETTLLFNDACRTGSWDPARVKQVFGERAKIEPNNPKIAYDSGTLFLTHYLTLPDLERLDMVGYVGAKDVLFETTEHIIDAVS